MENRMKMMCIVTPLLALLIPPVCGQESVLRRVNVTHYDDKRSWHSAQAFCRQHHTDLVTIRDETENLGIDVGWIGLYREQSTAEWKWSGGDEIADFISLKKLEPHTGKNCAFKKQPGEWQSKPCNKDHQFTCSDDTLVLVKENKTWEEALQRCRSLKAVDPSQPATAYMNHRYDLATLLTEDDHIFARQKAQAAGTNKVWTGLRYLAGQWVWVGGEKVQYEDINSCPTTPKLCGALPKKSSQLFSTVDCTLTRNFLCYKKS